MSYYIDSHCHINDKAFREDLDEVLERMVKANVRKALIVSSFIDDYMFSKTIKHKDIEFKRCLGVYPGDVNNLNDELFDEYKKLCREDDCVAVGEIGLDYYYGKDDKERQLEVFKAQCEFAREIDKPVIIHSRDAIQDTYDILKYYGNRGIMHCYSDSKEMAKEFVKLGFYISISGTITFKNAKEPLEVIKNVPLDRLLIETDCPYLTPVPNRGKRNEPSYVVYTAKRIIEELKIDEETFKNEVAMNYERALGKI